MRAVKTCSVEDCEEPHKALGYCQRHYDRRRGQQFIAHGLTSHGKKRMRPTPRPRRNYPDLVEDAQFLLDTGIGIRQTLSRLDTHPVTLRRAYQRVQQSVPAALYSIERAWKDKR